MYSVTSKRCFEVRLCSTDIPFYLGTNRSIRGVQQKVHNYVIIHHHYHNNSITSIFQHVANREKNALFLATPPAPSDGGDPTKPNWKVMAQGPGRGSNAARKLVSPSYLDLVQNDAITTILTFIGCGCTLLTYLIMLNWIYDGYLQLWDGVYGNDDDDDGDD